MIGTIRDFAVLSRRKYNSIQGDNAKGVQSTRIQGYLGLLLLAILDRNLLARRGRFNDVTGHGADHRIAVHDTATVSTCQLIAETPTPFHLEDPKSDLFCKAADGTSRPLTRLIEDRGFLRLFV